LAVGRGRALKGRYFDCEQDIGYVASMEEEFKEKMLFEVKMKFLPVSPNDGVTVGGEGVN
jgi:hypothetical protein